MPNSEYDNAHFFEEYAKMFRSQQGLPGAGEWRQFQQLFPDLQGKSVLDLGCGYGWHCKYAAQQGASRVLGIDLSQRMLAEARRRNADPKVEYRLCGMEEYEYPADSWDCVISNLSLHYVADIDRVFANVAKTLKPGGIFLLNIEHPCFTAGVHQDWVYGSDGNCQALLNYVISDKCRGCTLCSKVCPAGAISGEVRKQHHTLTQILMGLIHHGFELQAVEEAQPSPDMLDIPGMKDELRRPMMLLVRTKRRE